MMKMTTKNEPVTNPIDYWWKKYLAEHEKVQELEMKLKKFNEKGYCYDD